MVLLGGEHQCIAAQGQVLQGPVQEPLLLGAADLTIDQQQIEITANTSLSAAIAAKDAHTIKSGVLAGHSYRPIPDLGKDQLRLRPAQQRLIQ